MFQVHNVKQYILQANREQDTPTGAIKLEHANTRIWLIENIIGEHHKPGWSHIGDKQQAVVTMFCHTQPEQLLVQPHNLPIVCWIVHNQFEFEWVEHNLVAHLVGLYYTLVQHHCYNQGLGVLGSHKLHCWQPVGQGNLAVKMGMMHNQWDQPVHNWQQVGQLADHNWVVAGYKVHWMQVADDCSHLQLVQTHIQDMLFVMARIQHMGMAVV